MIRHCMTDNRKIIGGERAAYATAHDSVSYYRADEIGEEEGRGEPDGAQTCDACNAVCQADIEEAAGETGSPTQEKAETPKPAEKSIPTKSKVETTFH